MLSVTDVTGAGDISYQWYSNTTPTNVGGTEIPAPEGTQATYTPPGPFDTPGTFYYYVEISDDAAGCSIVASEVYTITVVPDPEVTIDLEGPLSYCQGADADTLTATPSGGVGTDYGYQWYSNTTNSNIGGTAIVPLEDTPTYTPHSRLLRFISCHWI